MVVVDLTRFSAACVFFVSARKDGKQTTTTFKSIQAGDLLKQHRQQIAKRVNQRKQEQRAAGQEIRTGRQKSSSQFEGRSPSSSQNGESKSKSPGGRSTSQSESSPAGSGDRGQMKSRNQADKGSTKLQVVAE